MSEKLLNRRNRWIIAGATGVLLVGGSAALATTAFADDGDAVNDNGAQVADDDDNDGDDDGTDDDGDDANPSTKPKISLADATATASDEVSKGILTSVELEGTNDAPVWRVDFITSDGTEHEVTIDATKGGVTDHNKEADDDGDKEDWTEAKAANDQVKTTPEDAATAALDKAGKNGTVTSVELDDDANNPQWEVDVTTDDGKRKDVTVDAVTGKATDVYTDDDGDNDSDDANDDDGDQDDDNDQGDDDANDGDND